MIHYKQLSKESLIGKSEVLHLQEGSVLGTRNWRGERKAQHPVASKLTPHGFKGVSSITELSKNHNDGAFRGKFFDAVNKL